MKRLAVALVLVAAPAFAQQAPQPPSVNKQLEGIEAQYAFASNGSDALFRSLLAFARQQDMQHEADAKQIADLQRQIADLTKPADPAKPATPKP